MTQTAAVLPLLEDVKEELEKALGADCVWQVRRLGPSTFQAWTRNNKTLLVTVRDVGTLEIKEQEGYV